MAQKDSARVSERAWRPRPGLDRAARSREQDRAAGGRGRRLVFAGGRERSATVVLEANRRAGTVRAVLRWSVDGRQTRVALGEVAETTRTANLREGWRLADEAGLLYKAPTPEASWASSPGNRASMLSNRGRDTSPELLLRRLLYRAGLRYRVSARPVPSLRRTADVVFRRDKIAVFVDGCFWHSCPEHRSIPKTNRDYWAEKLERNRARDAETVHLLEDAGWTAIRVWEHTPPEEAALLVLDKVSAARHGSA